MFQCPKDMTFQECELAILRSAVDAAEKESGHEIAANPETKRIIKILEDFLRKNKCVVYGGTAINNILPKNDQFYDYTASVPDYDFYSPRAFELAKELADIYIKEGFAEVQAKSGVHVGTYKVFVNFMGIADITMIDSELFDVISKDAIVRKGILYASANFLRMSMYLELSRPRGDISRWEKILKRLILLNKHYRMVAKNCEEADGEIEDVKLFNLVRNCFVQCKLVFIGGYANSLYSKYTAKPFELNTPDFDVLATDPVQVGETIMKKLRAAGYDVDYNLKPGVQDLIADHYELLVNKKRVAFVYKPLACHSYNTIHTNGMTFRVGSIDTLLSFYLAFMYANKPYYDPHRLLCMATMLFQLQASNRVNTKGLLKRFSTTCYGTQPTLTSIREEKSKLFKTLKRGSPEFDRAFLMYPGNAGNKTVKSPKMSPSKNTAVESPKIFSRLNLGL